MRRSSKASGLFLATGLATGLARDAAAQPIPPPPPEAPVVVRYEPDDPGVRLLSLQGGAPVDRAVWIGGGIWFQRGYAPAYVRLCDGPCAVQMSPGAYRFALARSDRVLDVPEVLVIQGPAVLRADYQDRAGLRAAGGLVSAVGVLGGVGMLVGASLTDTDCGFRYCTWSRHFDVPLFASGAGVLVAGLVVGGILLSQRDVARIFLEPVRF